MATRTQAPDVTRLRGTMEGFGVLWPGAIDRGAPPDDGPIFDMIEFAYEVIAEARDPKHHSYMSHSAALLVQSRGGTEKVHS